MSTIDHGDFKHVHGKPVPRVILVTGATGNVGRHVVTQLLHTGARVRALARDPASAGLPGGVDVVRGDLSAPGTLDACLNGVDAVFLLWPGLTADLAPAVLDAIRKHARRLVFLSSLGIRDDLERQPDPINAFHADIEHVIEQSGLEWTFLRPGGFATNTLWWAPQIRADGVVRWAYGACARASIHERDIAAVAVRVLTGHGHGATKYLLTGPRTLTQVEQVQIIGEVIGRSLRFEEISPEAMRSQLLTRLPPAVVDGALTYWARLVTEPEVVSPTVEEITGAPARPFRAWVSDHASDFLRTSGAALPR
jgi:uncharacterized protein YbjT (DUF2867 family)